MYMYINQLIVGNYVTPLRRSESFSFSLRSILLSFLLIFITSFFLPSRHISVVLEEAAPAARWKISVETAVDQCWFPVYFFSSFRFALIFRNICYTRRRTTSIGWHIKRKQHLDQSRRDNSYIQTWERREEYDVLSYILLAWRSV